MNTVLPEKQQPDSAVPDRIHLDFLDGVRALAALYVLLSHAFYMSQPSGCVLRWTSWLKPGHYAVAVFIVVSGCCLMLPVVRGGGTLQGGVARFLWRRARRILPTYYCSIALSMLLIACLIGRKTGTIWDSTVPVTFQDLLAHLFLMHDLFSRFRAKIDYPLWSIAVEWHIYFLFPLLVLGWKRLGAGPTTLLVFLAAGVVFEEVHGTVWEGIHPHLYALFALGMAAPAIVFSTEQPFPFLRDRLRWDVLFVGVSIAFLLCHVLTPNLIRHYEMMDLFSGLCTVALVVAATRPGKNPLRRFLSWRPLVFVGTFSYSLYLVHAPLLQTIWQILFHPFHLGGTPTFILLTFIGAPLIAAMSYLFFLLCERPYLNARANTHKKRPTPITLSGHSVNP